MSDERDGATAAGDSIETADTGGHGSQTTLATMPATRPLRPTGKRSRQRAVDEGAAAAPSADVQVAKNGTGTKTKATKKIRSEKGPSANPIAYVYDYLKQVVAELRKVIWPNHKQMVTYTSVVMVFLAFMVALVALSDVGLAKLVQLAFG